MKTLEYKQGYKKTKLGWIPEDWEEIKLGECFTLSSGITKPKNIQDNNSIFLNPVYGGNGIIGYTNEIFLDCKTIVIGRVGEKCGCIYYLNGLSKYWITDNALYINKTKIFFNYVYMYFLLQRANLNQYKNKGGQPLISQKPIYLLKIPLPPLPEQKKIAEILTCCDEVIEKIEKLIEQKELQKKALMQKLLTGKVRVKDFGKNASSPVKLKDYLKETTLKNKNNNVLNVLSVTNSRGFINQGDQFERSVASKDLTTYKIVKKFQFAYNPSRINVGSIDLLKTFEQGIVSPIYVVFETREDKLLSEYFKYFFKTYNFFEQMKMFTQGGVRDSLSFDGLCMMKMFIPSISEQQKIASVLNLCDKDINILKQKLEQLNLQKKGLMQKLLTGEIRVKI